MKTNPLRLLLAALLSVMLVVGSMTVPASARSGKWQPRGWNSGYSHYSISKVGGVHRAGYVKARSRSYRSWAPRHYRAPRRHYAPRYYRHRHRRRHDDSFVLGLGLGFLGGAILSAPYNGSSYSYRTSSRWCHVHRYRVRGITFHRDVRCWKHKNWNHPSIVYVN